MAALTIPTLAARVAGLELSPIAVWVFDPERLKVVWANAAAVEMWRAPSVEELCSRDFSDGPPMIMARLNSALEVLREGGAVWQEWTFFPKGVPVSTRLHFSPITLNDDRLGILQHAYPREGTDPELLRGITALHHTSVIVALVEFGGRVVMRNPAAQRAFGRDDDWTSWIGDPETAVALLARAEAGELVRRELEVVTTEGARVHAVELQPIRDTVTGEMMALVHQADQSARRAAEAEAARQQRMADELSQTLSLVDRQRREIIALSAPILEVADQVLTVPIIGALDRERGADIESRLLTAIRERDARVILVDLTGVSAVDDKIDEMAERLARLAGAARLLGARTILTGLTPALASALVDAGGAPFDVACARTLTEGLELAHRL